MAADLWARLEATLTQIYPEWPRGGLKPGATAAQIDAVESLIGVRFPEDLRQAYLHFNGMTPRGWWRESPDKRPLLLARKYMWLDLAQVAQQWVGCQPFPEPYDPLENDGDVDDCPVRCHFQDDLWIPIGADDWGGTLFVDMHPALAGALGQVFEQASGNDGDTGPVLAGSFTQLLEEMLASVAVQGPFPLTRLD
jgi:cell wall assembly regulator SMI1